MSWSIGLSVAAALVASLLLTLLVRARALARGVLDIPNERSSHYTPVPRGGGAAIVVVGMIAFAALALTGRMPPRVAAALLGGGLAVAGIGYLDDRRSVSPAIRLVVHLIAATWAIAWLGGLPPIRLGAHTIAMGYVGDIVAVLGLVWALNLFNFMDGIDGIAAAEGVFMCAGWAVLALAGKAEVTLVSAAVLFASACSGFLVLNWAPAKIFMGDVGSGFVGYVIATLALASATANSVALLIWLILGAVFVADATLTLFRRLLRGESPHKAHRSHAYQSLARRWGSHRRVTTAVTVVNIGWLLPNAWFAAEYPARAGWVLLVAIVPVIAMAAVAGAGSAAGEARTH
ncbi:MAG TPA: glycosyltransferase family 4 protein [Steroidobacteraceae bacterium]|jgi:Fuc2NAc and GlcNAc transferase